VIDEVAFAGLAGQAGMVRRGDVSAGELVELAISRISCLDPEPKAFGAVYADRALEEAANADARVAAGEWAPLLWIPVAVKDEIDIGGEITSYGTGAMVNRPRPTRTSCAGCGPPERSFWARPRCPSWGCGRSPNP
jgi:amidase